MENSNPIKFKVGEEYKNEKGLFEVMAVKGQEMVIRWETGEEITCDVRVQRRIQERRRWEKQYREKLAIAKIRSASASKASRPFKGLLPEDFQDKISRTPWRSRNQLGGAVTRHLHAKRPHLNSWAAKRRNVVDWADARHWKERKADCGVKFSAWANESAFAWGLRVLRPRWGAASVADWESFLKWLEDRSNELWIKDLALGSDMKIYNASQPGLPCLLSPQDGGWVAEKGKRSKTYDTLREAIDALPAAAGGDLMLARLIPKEDAVGLQNDIAQDVAELIERLLPLYEVVANQGDQSAE